MIEALNLLRIFPRINDTLHFEKVIQKGAPKTFQMMLLGKSCFRQSNCLSHPPAKTLLTLILLLELISFSIMQEILNSNLLPSQL